MVRTLLVWVVVLWSCAVLAGETTHHRLHVVLDPAARTLMVADEITPATARVRSAPLHVLLHGGLEPRTDTPGVAVEPLPVREWQAVFGAAVDTAFAVPVEAYRVHLPADTTRFRLLYGGKIHHPLTAEESYARGFRQTPGLISEDGVFLSGSSAWYPWLGTERISFDLEVEVPAGWGTVSQGAREPAAPAVGSVTERWQDLTPQEEIYLLASPYHTYRRRAGPAELSVHLRRDDEALAAKYLEVGAQYLKMYADLLGPYPYPKFALVENFWETGYGMPSFSLLGPRVIRFPFILHSSYPHEILHNWWGNGVYVDWDSGNWCEGLTAYLADHLIQEGRGQGATYRQTTLQKYADYAARGRDFPLVAFRSRHSSATEAVGYGKALLFYHMLRRTLGDEIFLAGLRDFYRRYSFQVAGYEDLRRCLERANGSSLEEYFNAWTRRPGAPQLELGEVAATRREQGWSLSFSLQQTQAAAPYPLEVPVALTVAGQETARVEVVALASRREVVQFQLPSRPLRVDVDPEFDVFRHLDPMELPPALSASFGAEGVTVVLPAAGGEALRQGYRELADQWARSQPGQWQLVGEDELSGLPAGRSVWVLGWDNRWRSAVAQAAADYGAELGDTGVRLARSTLSRDDHSFVLAVRHPDDPALTVTWLATDRVEALPGLGRKLPHYHKYSYLAFEGAEPANVAKGRWPVLDSPLSQVLVDGSGPGVLPARKPLAVLPPAFSAERMAGDLAFLTAPEQEGRGFGSAGAERAAAYIARQFEEAGLQPGGADGSYYQSWQASGGDPVAEAQLRNVVAILPGTRPEWSGQSVVLGAHYDHLGRGWPDVRAEHAGALHPGADDNASGVAVMLELARTLGRSYRPERSVVWVAFAGEEAGRLGSVQYLEQPGAHPPDRILGMVNLDTVGRLRQGRLLVLGTGTASEWVHIFRGAGFVTGVPIESVADDVGGSDQVSFVERGIPAVQLFTGPHADYHRPSDTADKIDLPGLVRVAEVTREVVEYLAGRPESLSRSVQLGREDVAAAGGVGAGSAGRKVSLGVVPDFAYPGPGVKLSGVTGGSPAEGAGLRAGDVLLEAGGEPVRSLRDLSRVLKGVGPGQELTLKVERAGSHLQPTVVLVPR